MAETDKLVDVLTKAGVTAIDTVPTLLSMFTNDVPNLRLILLGGEALPASVVERWAASRRIFNTYGPTEATVVATACEVRRGEPVTIGRPIPNYSCYVARGQPRSLGRDRANSSSAAPASRRVICSAPNSRPRSSSPTRSRPTAPTRSSTVPATR